MNVLLSMNLIKRVAFTVAILPLVFALLCFSSCGKNDPDTSDEDKTPESFVYVPGGTFTMGSPDNEAERDIDEIRHTVTVSGFYIASSELTQAQYRVVTGKNPSANQGDNLPVENVTWYDAVQYCNALSQRDGLTPAYTISGQTVTWNRSANGYRLPTEAEWEFACRAGSATPFNFGDYVNDSDANCYNAYGYNNNASGSWVNGYLQHSVAANSYSPNGLGLHDMHGNVAEWVWDCYGAYGTATVSDPAGPGEGNYKTARGGGWNDFPKHIRSAYRSAFPADVPLYGIGIRLARNAEPANVTATSTNLAQSTASGKVLIAYFSQTGNTKGFADIIESVTGADIFRIERKTPYSSTHNSQGLYAEALDEQRQNALPELAAYLEDAGLNINDYNAILLGYSNWWASIPAPVHTFLTRYDLSGKTIIPFCSQGGGRFGQTISAIAKLAPNSTVKEGLYVTYSSYDRARITEWLESHNIQIK
ncbi:MAG: SUMF1/EgtB/PvdO family nonheme iron enzyme [Bacteroidales bacterium]|jgi:formylglycine-generating enzyme required for sulfatase activity/flavodoxin|nr:SUMF1/EgtB/PvdO family nonheme iron enzyme [Bacteroidales bacterium]